MIKKIFTFLLGVRLLTACLSTSFFTFATASNISLEQITKDVAYLASDNLKGRGNFSPELSQAADYIAKRFKESGLIEATGISAHGFLQKYQLTKTTPKTLSLVLNGKAVSSENLTIASTVNKFSWVLENGVKTSEFEIHNVNENDDLQFVLSNINKQGGNHFVLLNPAHKEIFKRYQHYFAQGLIKLTAKETSQGGVIVIALSDVTVEEVKNLNVSGVNNISKSNLTNVVAVLRGKTKPEEIILYSAHYDHLGLKITKNNTSEDKIYNGADDDASGTAAIINIAQYYAKQGNNARTLMFAAFSAEEIGGFGSRYFSQQLDPKKIIAMINIEMIGKPSKFGAGTLWMTGIKRSNLGDLLNSVLAKSGKKINQDPYPEQNLFYRSDNTTLARLGVPAHSFSSAQLDKDQHYHQVSDNISSLDLSSLYNVIKTLAIATQPLVDGSITPSRIDANNVKGKGLIY